MVKVLRNLKIREVSSVDKGAGEGVQIVLMKRATTSALDTLTTMAAELRKSEAALTSEQAFAKVYTDPRNRELVAQCKAEERARRDAVTMAKGARSTIGDRVARLAAALAQQHKELTHDDAIQRVLARNPDLARAYQNELKA